MSAVRPTVVLDDDPTGVQLLQDVPVLLSWSPPEIRAALGRAPCVHLVTNTRAMEPDDARATTRSAALAALEAAPGCRVVLRGDSTLRAHLREEYDAVRSVVVPAVVAGTVPAPVPAPVHLLVPAMPSAGRTTLGGVHRVVADGRPTPVGETEYARDGGFTYTRSRLLEYAEERSGGFFAAVRGVEVPLPVLRREGAPAVARALRAAAEREPGAVVAPDAETVADLRLVLAGLRLAEEDGVPVIVRCAPTFAALFSGGPAPALVPPPAAPHGLLVVCGSYVQGTTRQLARLHERTGAPTVEVDVAALAAPDDDVAEAEVRRVAADAAALLRTSRVVVVTTPRTRPPALSTLGGGARIARRLARAAAAVRPAPSVVLTKGGITSAVTLRDGFGVREATVRGPVATGVSWWSSGPGLPEFVVFPGNVGGDGALADVVELLTRS